MGTSVEWQNGLRLNKVASFQEPENAFTRFSGSEVSVSLIPIAGYHLGPEIAIIMRYVKRTDEAE